MHTGQGEGRRACASPGNRMRSDVTTSSDRLCDSQVVGKVNNFVRDMLPFFYLTYLIQHLSYILSTMHTPRRLNGGDIFIPS